MYEIQQKPVGTNFVDLEGERIGMLTVIGYLGRGENRTFWLCKCDCGNLRRVISNNIRSGSTKSCGCFKETRKITHGDSLSRLYHIFKGIKSRCFTVSNKRYKDYGGRGITMCQEWRDFKVFRDWALNNGYRDDLTIERSDVDGDYNSENCTWIPLSEQGDNKRNSIIITAFGESKTIIEWCKDTRCTVKSETLYNRFCIRGFNAEEAITHPHNTRRSPTNKSYNRKYT